ncbi:AAA family ATPase [Alkaliphilus sp. B6464]|uniref:AAA family ATPase n=1 Tax=Alkaliphilus sp. B6464 TaxID=2731219 RepID=UPI001BAADD03|nr:AAA family ATPase [Alkaliphilus sp. B6464]QUH22027.1 AAA family ATPase [Alkaliphilus sp. B6464]
MKTVLFIENDTYWFQQISSHFMLKPEYKIEYASNMLEAMNRIQSGGNVYYAIVINTSAIMQNSDEGQVIASIKEKVPFAKIICVLENNDPYKFVSLSQNGANGVLVKPYTIDAICAELEKDIQNMGGGVKQQPPQPVQNFGGFTSPQQPPYPQSGGNLQGQEGYNPYQQQGYGYQMPQKGNVENPDNVKIGNLGDMGQEQRDIHEFRPKQFIPNSFDGNNPSGGDNYGQQGGMGHGPNGYGMNQNPMHPPMQPPYGNSGWNDSMPNNRQVRGNGVVRIPSNTAISIHSPKGGVGKSTISKELAITYATSNVNGNRLRVCLLDMDIDYGDIAVMLELKQNKSIADWARNIRSRMSNMNENDIWYSLEEIERYYLLEHKSGLKVLAAPTNYRDSALINEQIVRIIINNLKKHFDIIVVDTGPNVKDYTVISMELSDHIVMVCNMDVSTINEILTLRKTLEQIQFPLNKIGLVMNEIKSNDNDNINHISNFLGLPLIGTIPRFAGIEVANNNGDTLVMGRDNAFTIGLKRIANTILPVVRKGDDSPSRSPVMGGSSNKPKQSIFSSLFNKKK